MFCFQCQEALGNKGCTVQGVCGKDGFTAEMQDLLIWISRGAAFWANELKKKGISREKGDHQIAENLFTTITNVNFEPAEIFDRIKKTVDYRNHLMSKATDNADLKNVKKNFLHAPYAALVELDGPIDAMEKYSEFSGILSQKNEDIRSLRELLLSGLKGISAYVDHAVILKRNGDQILDFIDHALSATVNENIEKVDLVALVMEAGKFSVDAMALLDEANTGTYGNPVVTEAWTGTASNAGIIISGHDLLDLEELLKQTEGKGIDIYTHGEMLPAHGYPELKKYSHLKGNFGTSWYNQQREFSDFEGPILMTTNCIQKPLAAYFDRIYTTGLVRWPGVTHIPNVEADEMKDFSAVIEQALKIGPLEERKGKKLIVGFGRNTLVESAGTILELISKGAIKRFFVMSGCDGRHKDRDYYTKFAEALPKDTVILTSGCAKYRYNMLDLGDIEGLPRVIDAGQCNDSYSLAYIALQLKEVLKVEDINDLPISFNVAWYEQKAVTVLLGLLYLGVKKIRLGPTLPAFLSPGVVKVLVENFDIRPITTVEKDLADMLENN